MTGDPLLMQLVMPDVFEKWVHIAVENGREAGTYVKLGGKEGRAVALTMNSSFLLGHGNHGGLKLGTHGLHSQTWHYDRLALRQVGITSRGFQQCQMNSKSQRGSARPLLRILVLQTCFSSRTRAVGEPGIQSRKDASDDVCKNTVTALRLKGLSLHASTVLQP